jgi:hypothetical protein
LNLRTAVDRAQKGYDEERRMLATLPGVLASEVSTFANLIERTSNPVLPPLAATSRGLLKDVALRFHKNAGTLTHPISQSIERFIQGAPVIRIAHTADLFPYLGVFAACIYLDSVARKLESGNTLSPSQIFILVDHENIADKRLRSCKFPDVDREHGAMLLSSPIPEESYAKSQFSIQKPLRDTVTHWLSSLELEVSQNVKVLYRMGIPQIERGTMHSRLAAIENEVWESYERASSLSEFNAIFTSRILTLHWGIPILFFPVTQVAPLMLNCYEYLIQQYPRLVEASIQVVESLRSEGLAIKDNLELDVTHFPLWYLCDCCLSRVPMRCLSRTKLDIVGLCPTCESSYRFELGTFANPHLDPIRGRLLPKVLFDELADIVGWQISGGVSYIGSAEHVITNSLIAARLKIPVPPESLIRTRGIYYGLAEARVLPDLSNSRTISRKERDALEKVFFGRSSVLYFILAQGIDGLFAMWRQHFENGHHFYDLNIGSSAFRFSAEDLQLLANAMSSLDDPAPCIASGN